MKTLLAKSFNSITWLGSRLIALLLNIVESLDRYHGAVAAIATIVLAIITGAYLLEVREQRIFNYTQLALENRPILEIQSLAPFEYGEAMRTRASINNSGGVIENLRGGIVFLCCRDIEEAVIKPQDLEILAFDWYIPRLGRGRGRNRFMSFTAEQRQWLEPALKDKAKNLVYAYVRTDYIQPASPLESELHYSDTASFWWNPRFQIWMSMSKQGHLLVERVVEARGIFEYFEKPPQE